jgi:hypothetical protein
MLTALHLLSEAPTADDLRDLTLRVIAHSLAGNGPYEVEEVACEVVGALVRAWATLERNADDYDEDDAEPWAEPGENDCHGWFPEYRQHYAKAAGRDWNPGDDWIHEALPQDRPLPYWLVVTTAGMHAEHDARVSRQLRAMFENRG